MAAVVRTEIILLTSLLLLSKRRLNFTRQIRLSLSRNSTYNLCTQFFLIISPSEQMLSKFSYPLQMWNLITLRYISKEQLLLLNNLVHRKPILESELKLVPGALISQKELPYDKKALNIIYYHREHRKNEPQLLRFSMYATLESWAIKRTYSTSAINRSWARVVMTSDANHRILYLSRLTYLC